MEITRVKLLILFSSLLLPAIPITAENTYTPSNINGGWVRRVVEAPGAPGTFYACSYGIFKSTDGGQTWRRTENPAPPSSVGTVGGCMWGRHSTSSIAVSSTNANVALCQDLC
jgi:hypothetical protein